MSKILGSYVLETSHNFDEFMKALGVGLVTRKLANATSPTIIFTEKDGVYNMKTVSTVKSYDISFKIGVEFDELASDGRKCKTTFTKDGENKLIQVQKAENGKDAKYVREFTDTHLNLTCDCDGVECKRTYKRKD
ncbi:UNVERIFIED_CONTAM: hypothetical protein RMT77_010468 [Armadillidium vulgare]